MHDTGQTKIILTEKGIGDLYLDPGRTPELRDEFAAEMFDTLPDDMENVADSVVAIGKVIGGDKLAENFKKFKNAVDTDGDKDISAIELETYITNISQGYLGLPFAKASPYPYF